LRAILPPKAIDAGEGLPHKLRAMTTTTKRTAKTKAPSGGSGAVRA